MVSCTQREEWNISIQYFVNLSPTKYINQLQCLGREGAGWEGGGEREGAFVELMPVPL
jgi:hypothetical protein